jgi:hypothetical protein
VLMANGIVFFMGPLIFRDDAKSEFTKMFLLLM